LKSLNSNATTKPTEKVFLIGVELKSRSSWEVRDSLDELAELATTAGGEVIDLGIQKLDAPIAATYLGKGKVEEFATRCREQEIDTVIFDDELSPAQSRNLEKKFDCKILDRTSLILDIFAQRAQTREGKLQVELAQLHHILPRLTRMWTHLSRQRGGIGMRGDGESQLEADRRRINERIEKLGIELESVRRQRSTQRQGRQRHQWPLASIVGYTNAGKSTLLNALTGSEVLSEDKLFATLDPTTRRLQLPTNQNILISDTVGFIKKLPHKLVEAFKATLEEVVEADLLVHVVDISHPQFENQIKAVVEVLDEIGVEDKTTLLVFNKIDSLLGKDMAARLMEAHPGSVAISAKSGEGFQALLAELGVLLRPIRQYVQLAIPFEKTDVMSRLHEIGQVVDKDFEGDLANFKVRIPPSSRAEFEPYLIADLT
jgi:GTP-binding protein HflX